MKFGWIVSSVNDGKSIEYMLKHDVGMSARLIRNFKAEGVTRRNGRESLVKSVARFGDVITIELPLESDTLTLKSDLPFPVLFENDWVIVVNKPAGMIIHPTISEPEETLIDFLSDDPLSPVTRLDRYTSGAVIVAKNGHAHFFISEHPQTKEYIAYVHGDTRGDGLIYDVPASAETTVFDERVAPLTIRDPATRAAYLRERACPPGWEMLYAPIERANYSFMNRVVHPFGKEAATFFRTETFFPKYNVSKVRYRLITGRTHQIRVHSLWAGHPLLGDHLYGIARTTAEEQYPLPRYSSIALGVTGNVAVPTIDPGRFDAANRLGDSEPNRTAEAFIRRQALHAAAISFVDPLTRRRVELSAPASDDLIALDRSLSS